MTLILLNKIIFTCLESCGWKGEVKILLAIAAEKVQGSNPGGIKGNGKEYLVVSFFAPPLAFNGLGFRRGRYL